MRALIMLILLILSNISQARGICHSTYERLYLKTHPKLKGTSARIRLQKRPVVHFPLNRDNSPASGGAILFTRRTHSMSLHSLRPTVFAAAAILCLASAASPIAAQPSLEKAKPQVQPFALSDVRLLDGAFRNAMLLDKQYLLSLDPDRLLHMFRINAGLPSSAQPYGGWEAPGCEVRGHSMGHYLSACALMYAGTGDEALKTRANRIVAELAKCQEALAAKGANKGYLSAFPESFINRGTTIGGHHTYILPRERIHGHA